MNRQDRNIRGNSAKAHEKSARKGFDDNMLLNTEDSVLFESIGEYLKGRLDLEEVRNDPALPEMEGVVKEMISDYNKNKTKIKNDEKFIRDIFAGGVSDEKLLDDISNIKYEINNTNVNDISAEWVMEWHEKRQKNVAPDPKSEEIRKFVIGSLESENREVRELVPDGRNKGKSRSLIVRYLSLSAAAVLGAFFLIRTLIPSYDPDKLFNSYYEPMSAILPVTRSGNTGGSDNFASEIEKYKLGDYQTAAIGFSSALQKDQSAVTPRFFMGLTQVAMGNYDQAIELLSTISEGSAEYGKEARWYLGLAYLKAGKKEQAAGCFKLLAQSPGYYSERSEKILRHLK